MMKKTIYLTILTIVTVLCIIFGVFYHVIGRITGRWIGSLGGVISYEETNFAEQLNPYDSIQMDIAAAEVIIQNGEDFGITYEGAKILAPDYEVKNRVLNIGCKSQNLPLKGNLEGTITLTIPRGTTLGNASLDVDAGTLEIRDFVAEDFNVDVDAGNVEIYDGSFGRATFDVDAGNISLNDCTFDRTEASADMGNVEYNDCIFNQLEATADLGNVEVHSLQNLDNYRMDIQVDLGNLEINGHTYVNDVSNDGGSDGKLSITVNLGNACLTY